MQPNYLNQCNPYCIPATSPNAVNINIISPQAYANGASGVCGATSPINNGNYYSLYGQNMQPTAYYPQNYNNMMYPYNPNMPQNMANMAPYQNASNNQGQGADSSMGMTDSSALRQKTAQEEINTTNTIINKQEEAKESTKEKTKKITPLTNEYVQSLENYMNNDNPKVRLIGTKELLERFKEDENRKDNASLMPLLNKALRDSSPAVRFLGLTALQLGYAVGNDETVTILKEIQSKNDDKIGEDSLLASEILLNMSAGQKVEVPMTQEEISKAEQKETKQQGSK
ncbi:MAG: hypothetical protein IKL52_02795 [Candidatus Gastranaerophilales bacterium]|nr:hypothetical protein [Candidatus Gastranaerophilales bacterium]